MVRCLRYDSGRDSLGSVVLLKGLFVRLLWLVSLLLVSLVALSSQSTAASAIGEETTQAHAFDRCDSDESGRLIDLSVFGCAHAMEQVSSRTMHASASSSGKSIRRAEYGYDAPLLLRVSRTSIATKTRPCASFRADTLVLMADGTKKPISEIEVGDKVIATDSVTGKKSIRKVTRLFTHIDDDLLDLVVLTDDGVETIHTTDHHRFWSASTNAWVEAKDLKGGERLRTANSDLVTIGRLTRVPGAAPMLDLTVEYDHTFYVALNDSAVLVHNNNCWPTQVGGNCAECATQIQEQLGDGRVMRITSDGPALGPSTNNPSGNWTFHDVVLKDGMIYDSFTGPKGMPAADYIKQFQYSTDLKLVAR
jgi:Pretoxin HINT domain